MHRKAFTLIELLIVVAIIAILAAIAVPNFLEANVRAKVSRAKSDLRTLRVALESYQVDHNHYPEPATNNWHPSLLDIPIITSPVAYLTSFPTEPFPLRELKSDYGYQVVNPEVAKYYRYYNTRPWVGTYPDIESVNLKWSAMSNGPDLDIAVNDDESARDTINGKTYMYYDPTNGTVSRGDLIETNLKSAH
jgi:type II secretion system protein G